MFQEHSYRMSRRSFRRFRRLDVRTACANSAFAPKVRTTFGRLDVLVNNAGTAVPKPFEEATLEEMDRVLNINVRGVYVATQAALKHMKSGGRIIMIVQRWVNASRQGLQRPCRKVR